MTVKELSSEVKTPASAVSCIHDVKAIVKNVVSRLVEREIPKGQSLWLSGVLLMCRLYKMERPSTQKVGNNQIFNRSG